MSNQITNNLEQQMNGASMLEEDIKIGDPHSQEPNETSNTDMSVGSSQGSSTGTVEEEIKLDDLTPAHTQVLSALLTELKPINYREKAGLSDGEQLTSKHLIVITIEEILSVAKEKKWSMCVSDGFVWVYNGEYWKQIQKQELSHFLGLAAEKLGMEIYYARHHSVRCDLQKQFFATAYLPKPERKGQEVLINLANGTYVITHDQQSLRPFERADFLKYLLPFNFDPNAKAPLFLQYLNRVLPDPNKQMILAEYISSVFIRQRVLKLEKSLILLGDGANGKSVFFDVISALLGKENISHYSLQSLTNGTGYYRAKLVDKLLNYASEISQNMDTSIFKQMASGEPVEARLPYGEPLILEDYAKLIFNTNSLPTDVEQTAAFFRRFLILHFDVTIPEEERDPQLAIKIIKDELAGVFNWVLEGLQRLIRQRRFTFSQGVEDMIQQYRHQSDPVQMFLSDDKYEPSLEGETALKVMYGEYKMYCSENGYKACSLRVFSERLRRQGFTFWRKNKGTVVGAAKINNY